MTTGALLLRGAVLADGTRADVTVRDGLIASIDRPGPPAPDAPAQVEDLSGCLLLPAPVEIHAHLDKALTADRVANPAGDLLGAVGAWLAYRPGRDREDIAATARAALRAYVGNGVTALRTHVDLGTDIGLRGLEALLELREEAAGLCRLQLVAFAANPLTGVAGAANRALLRDALAAGADAVGACPGLDADPAECVEICLELAADHGVAVDLHVDEWLRPEPCTLALLADAVLATGFPYGVVASHCVSLGAMEPDRAAAIARRVAAAGIAVAALPQTNLYLQGRDHDRSVPRGITALSVLRAAGVTVAAGGDNLQDPFNCLGRADPLETAALLVLAGHDTPQLAYDAVSAAARAAAGLPPVALRPGDPADLLAVRAANLREALSTASAERVVVHAGRVVARTEVHRTFTDLPAQTGTPA
ncbi:cytosine deaminase [Catellatospora sp. TT07R-123]|uniref:amidohydrolase family protein n=1 Tax=Catellatospora sp. TT07R-123 TaxID=2733863 RepID=UPI001B010236|nr:amidohydrolase family protein [Catellatospora sp. TT07R-123]GHJ44283.1 cytosine deaminase [Catellatospora sp. TT07R-123]